MSEPAKDEAPRLEIHHQQMRAKLRVPEALLVRAQIRSVSHCEARGEEG